MANEAIELLLKVIDLYPAGVAPDEDSVVGVGVGVVVIGDADVGDPEDDDDHVV